MAAFKKNNTVSYLGCVERVCFVNSFAKRDTYEHQQNHHKSFVHNKTSTSGFLVNSISKKTGDDAF